MYCPKCGKEVGEDDLYCRNCDTKLKSLLKDDKKEEVKTEEPKIQSAELKTETKEPKLVLNSPILILSFILFLAALFMNSYTGNGKWWTYYIYYLILTALFYYIINRKKINCTIINFISRIKKGE